MKKTFSKYSNSIQRELFFTFIIINLLTVSICFIILYVFTSGIMTQTHKESDIEEFQQISYNLSLVANETANIIDILSSSSQLQDQLSINSLSDSLNVISTKDTFNLLSNYLRYYPYIESIYCYMDDGTIIGEDRNMSTFLPSLDQTNLSKYAFNNKTDFIKKVFADNSHLFSEGGFTGRNFNYGLGSISETRYITFARSFKLFTPQSYVLVVNVNENYFRSLYDKVSEVNNSTYLIDNSGKIISDQDSNMINKMSLSYMSNKIIDDSGSYYLNGKQIVYCRVPNTSFMLIRETVLNDMVRNISVIRNIFICILVFNFILILIFSRVSIQKIIRPLNKLAYSMHKIEQGDFSNTIDEIPGNEIGMLNKQFNKMSSSIIELLERNKAIEEDKRKIEIKVLHAQINPHFLYNTLNTLKWMAILSNSINVAEGLTAMGNLLKHLYSNNDTLWSLKQEYDFIQNYIKIMNYRYGGGIFVTVSFPEDLMDYTVLTFMLQPILENSFIHGLKIQGNSGEISIKASSDDEDIFFEIKDNGEGMSEEILGRIKKEMETDVIKYGNNGMSFGNVNKRIKLNYGEKYGIQITSSIGIGTTVIIKIPKIKK